MRKSNKQRRISQDTVVPASLQEELFSFLFDRPSVTTSKDERRKRSHDDEGRQARFETIIRSFPCVCMENEAVIKQVHGLLVLQLSASLATGTKRSYKRDTIGCLEALYNASYIENMLDIEEKLVVSDVLLRTLGDSGVEEESASLIRLCFSIMRNLFKNPDDWRKLQRKKFQTLLISLATELNREQAMRNLQTIVMTTEGSQQHMAKVVQHAMSEHKNTFHHRIQNDSLSLLYIEIKLRLGSDIQMEWSMADRLVLIASQNSEMARQAATCLALAGEKQPDDTAILTALFRILLNGTDQSSIVALSGIYSCISSGKVNLVTLDYVGSNMKSVICCVIQVLQLNAHEDGKLQSVKAATVLQKLISTSHNLHIDIAIADLVSICGALLENPHVEVSSCMCNAMIDSLSCIESGYGPEHIDALEMLAKFVVDQTGTVDDAASSRRVIHFYSALMDQRNTCLADLPRIPHFVESIVKISSRNWERVLLKEPCVTLLVKLSSSPLNQRRMARTSGVIPMLVKYGRELDEQQTNEISFEKVKECIQTLADAI